MEILVQKFFDASLGSGIWQKIFVQCIMHPASLFSEFFAKEARFVHIIRNQTQKFTSCATEYMEQRFYSPFAASMVRCLRDNGRFLSVSSYMKTFSPTLYDLLTKELRRTSVFNYKDFMHNKEKELSVSEAAGSNIPPLLAVLFYLCVESRKFLLASDEAKCREICEQWEENQEDDGALGPKSATEESDPMDLEKTDNSDREESDAEIVEASSFESRSEKGEEKDLKGRDDDVDEGEWFSVVNPSRTLLFKLPVAKKSAKVEPGTAWKKGANEAEFKWGRSLQCDWGKITPLFYFPGMLVEDACPIDEFLHMITTGGFKNPSEEKRWFDTNPKFRFTDKDDLTTLGSVGRQITSVREFWKKLEKVCPLFLTGTKITSGLDWGLIVERMWKILDGSLPAKNFPDLWDPPEDNMKNKTKNKEATNDVKIAAADGFFTKKELKTGVQGKEALKSIAHQLQLKAYRACLHLGAADAKQKDLFSYTLESNFNNDLLGDKKGATWRSEGELLSRMTTTTVKMTRMEFRDQIRKIATQKKKRQKSRFDPLNVGGKFVQKIFVYFPNEYSKILFDV